MEIPYEIFFFFSKTNFYEFGFTGWEVEVPSLLQKAEQKKKICHGITGQFAAKSQSKV